MSELNSLTNGGRSILSKQITWKHFQSSLFTSILDINKLRKIYVIVEECVELENYLFTKFEFYKKEPYFASKMLIAGYINQSLKVNRNLLFQSPADIY